MEFDEHTKGYFFAVSSAAVLATTGICIRYLTATHGMEPLVLAFWRNLLLVLPLLLILECCFPKLVEIGVRDLPGLAGHGLILALFNFFWIESVRINGAGVATFLVYSSVPFSAVLGWMLLKEQLHYGKITAILVAMYGCFLVSATLPEGARFVNLAGLLFGLVSGFCFAAYSTSAKCFREKGLNSWTMMLYSFAFAAAFLFLAKGVLSISKGTAFFPVSEYFSLGGSVPGWGVLLLLAVGPTLIGFGLYNVSLGYLPSGTVNLIATTEPPLTAVLAYLLLGERLTVLQICGCLLIITAIVMLKSADRLRSAHPVKTKMLRA